MEFNRYILKNYIEYMQKSDVFVSDSTFLAAPEGYCQIYVFYGYYLRNVFRFAFFNEKQE
jgi:hypothetical protein